LLRRDTDHEVPSWAGEATIANDAAAIRSASLLLDRITPKEPSANRSDQPERCVFHNGVEVSGLELRLTHSVQEFLHVAAAMFD